MVRFTHCIVNDLAPINKRFRWNFTINLKCVVNCINCILGKCLYKRYGFQQNLYFSIVDILYAVRFVNKTMFKPTVLSELCQQLILTVSVSTLKTKWFKE